MGIPVVAPGQPAAAPPAIAGAARAERSRVELQRLSDEHDAWQLRRRGEPEAQRYASQLDAVGALVSTGVSQLAAELKSADLTQPPGIVYEACRTLDLRVLWLRRVWEFFREKFDQRDGDLADLLRAADEVVWSCYQQVFERARYILGDITPAAPPLPFIEPRYSPAMFPADLVPSGLRSEVDQPFLREHLNRLPVPVVRLQPGCVSEPWWLIYAAHEVGHAVQFDLLPRQALVDAYQELTERAVRAAGGEAADVARWAGWSREVFADIFSVLMMGPWAIWALVELELQSPDAMARRRDLYPSGAVRLTLLAAVAAGLRLDPAPALRGIRPREIAARAVGGTRDVALADAVAAASLAPLPALGAAPGGPGAAAGGRDVRPGGRDVRPDEPDATPDGPGVTLAELCGFRAGDFTVGGVGDRSGVDGLRDRLATGQAPARALAGPRLSTAAALAAWADLMPAASDDARADLARRSLCLITASGPPGSRAAAAHADADGPADRLIRSLLAAGRADLEAG